MKKMKNFKKLLVLTLVITCLFVFGINVYANEGDYGYYGYDESGGIYDFELLEENAKVFEENTGVSPYVLVVSYLGNGTSAKDFAQGFYDDETNYNDIFSRSNYFILIISDEEETMDIWASEKASTILTDKLIQDIVNKYSGKVDNTEYYDVLIYDILTDTQDMILNTNIKTPIPSQTVNNNNLPASTSNNSSTGTNIFIMIVLLTTIIGVIGVVLTKITFSFIHKRKKAEEEHEIELERLYKNNDDISKKTQESNNYSTDTPVDQVFVSNSSSNITHITNVYKATPKNAFVPTSIIVPHHETPREHHNEPIHNMHVYTQKPKPEHTTVSKMAKPTTPAKRSSSLNSSNSSSKSSSSMRKPNTPTSRQSKSPSGTMRKPSTPTRRGK